jgi:hypothetical protein
MKRLLLILLLLPLFIQGQEVLSLNKKVIAIRYRQIPNTISAWNLGTGVFTEVNPNTPSGYIQCSVAGTAYLASTQAYGEWYFDYYKGSAAGIDRFVIMADAAYNTNYQILISGSENVRLYEGAINIIGTAAGYININTWYSFKITRTSTGLFTIYIKGGSFGNLWTLISTAGGVGTNPIINTTYTTSSYIGLNSAVDFRIRNVRFLPLNQNKLSLITHD